MHNCLRDSKNSFATARFLANEFKNMIYENPNTSTKTLSLEAEKHMHLYVSKSTCKRAKKIFKTELHGGYLHEFRYIGVYLATVRKTNPGTTAELELNDELMQEGKNVFKRLYLCFDALKRGWKIGCRPVIGLDGCHLKGIVKGQILVVVGKDGANQVFPIAWAVIGKENKDNWTWFLEHLVTDLEISQGGTYVTIISDMQKVIYLSFPFYMQLILFI